MKKTAIILTTLLTVVLLISGCDYDSTGSSSQREPSSSAGTPDSASDDFSIDAILEKVDLTVNIETNPLAVIEMENGGVIIVELYPDVASNTVNNFITLANSGFYDGLIFHRVIPGFMIQGGDPEGTGIGGPGYGIVGEFSNNGYNNDLTHRRGVISMARSMAVDSAGSQFFICVADSTFLDGDYAAFGETVYGMETADEVAGAPRDGSNKPNKDQRIKAIRVDTKGINYPEPEKMN